MNEVIQVIALFYILFFTGIKTSIDKYMKQYIVHPSLPLNCRVLPSRRSCCFSSS